MPEERRLFAIDGLFCAGCARGLERRLKALDGVADAGVHFVTASALVRWDMTRCGFNDLARSVAQAGYRLIERSDPAATLQRFDAEVRRLSLRLAVAVLFGMWSMAPALLLYVDPALDPAIAWWVALASGIFAMPVLIYSAAGFWRMAVRSLRLRSPGLDLLVCLGALGATMLSILDLARGSSLVFFDTATMLVTLLLVGRLIETRVRRGAIAALGAVDGLAAECAQPVGGGAPVACISLAIGDELWVDAGAVVPMDGIVVSGESRIDRAILTGESAAVPIVPGGRVQAGTINLRRRITIRVDRISGDRDLDRMGGRIAIEMAARGEPARQIDAIVDHLALVVPLLAAVVAIVTILATHSPLLAMERALAVLIVVCPCSLAIAAPLVHVRASVIAATMGFRIADPAAFELLGRARTVIFDKTGTITLGQPEVIAVEPGNGWAADQVLALAGLAEAGIDHPIARAIAIGAATGGTVTGERHARGAYGRDEDGSLIEVHASCSSDGPGTRLDVVRAGCQIGMIMLADAIDPASGSAIALLTAMGLQSLLATGDASGPALAVAHEVGLPADRVHAGCTPHDKVVLLAQAARPVIMVGDGVNDAPALAAADCGVAVGRAHQAATATAGIVLTECGIAGLPGAVALSRRARRLIRQNWVLALAYNVVVLPAAALGWLTPLLAAAAMLASSVVVISNAMRLSVPKAKLSFQTERKKFNHI